MRIADEETRLQREDERLYRQQESAKQDKSRLEKEAEEAWKNFPD